MGSLGEKIGEGTVSDVHAWAPGKVVKLFKAGFPRRLANWEARMTRAAHASALPAPEVFDEVAVGPLVGIVLTHLEGPTLRQLSRPLALTSEQVGVILAGLAIAVHRSPPPAQLLSLQEHTAALLRRSGEKLPAHIASAVNTLLDRLPEGDGFCHGDLHSGNVIMSPDGPKLIDWTGAIRAPAAYDLATSHVLLSEFIHPSVIDPERLRGVDAAFQAEYAQLKGSTPAELAAAVEAYMPIVCVNALLGGAWTGALRERMIERIEAALRASG